MAEKINSDSLVVTTPDGTFRGSFLTSLSGKVYEGFRGIPFALPPIGKLRFAKPEPHPKIQGTFDASKECPVSLQPSDVTVFGPGQEDCLYLNVFKPAVKNENECANSLKEVFVFIHGGAFFMGSANQHVPGDLVAWGNIIVVTLNYRLSWLGFTKGNTDRIPGNLGLWDQLLGLQWIKKNIEYFGGDPNNITLGGESMGGESVTALSILPQAKDLFTKGIIMSGTMFSSRSLPKSSDVLLDLLAKRVELDRGIKTADETTSSAEINSIVDSLLALPEEKFRLPTEGTLTNSFTSIDGDLFKRPIPDMINDTDYLSQVGFFSRDYLVTLTNNEGSVYFHGVSGGNAESGSKAEYERLRGRFPFPDKVFEKLYDWYKSYNCHPAEYKYALISDFTIMDCTFKFLKTFNQKSEMESNKGKQYFLLYDLLPSYAPQTVSGVGHALDLTYLFDIEPEEMYKTYYGITVKDNFSETDWELKRAHIDMLVSFMKTGKLTLQTPNCNKIDIPEFNCKDECYLRFKENPSVEKHPFAERRKVWSDNLPVWLNDPSLI